MTDSTEEPLEGDIGPAARAGTRPSDAARRDPGADAEEARTRPAGDPHDEQRAALEELRRYEAEREDRRRRTNARAGAAARWFAGALLIFLLQDAVRAAAADASAGRSWLYPPGAVAAGCAAGLVALLIAAVRRR